MSINARIMLWGTSIGAVSWLDEKNVAVFQYDPDFVHSNIELSPITMPLKTSPYTFPSLNPVTFKGLPGLLADSLPDMFGNAVIDAWLASQGRTPDSFNPVERLCYTGKRGMGALEFKPAIKGPAGESRLLEIDNLVDLANQILESREGLSGYLTSLDDRRPIEDILRVGTSAGGGRAKAILAWNPSNGRFKSGQVNPGKGYEHWIMKFDGVNSGPTTTLMESAGYGNIEYAYYLMAKEIGIEMSECRIHHEGGRNHFMTKRFDRTVTGDKIHMQTLGGMAHFDYRLPAIYSYEQAIHVCRKLKLQHSDIQQLVLRCIFNVIGCNNDDHVKNISFLMDRRGRWNLSPAYDLTYAWNPKGMWTNQHQMSVNGKRKNISRDDLYTLARFADIKIKQVDSMINRVLDVFEQWKFFAKKAGVSSYVANMIAGALVTNL